MTNLFENNTMAENEFHLQIARELGAINEKLNALPEIKDHLKTLNGRVGKNENELRDIKVKAGLISTIAGSVVFFAWDILKSKIF